MNDLRTAAQQALEALEWISDCHVGDDDDAGECASCHQRSYKPHAPDCKKNNAIAALRAALAHQAEPIDTDCHAQGICQRSGYGIGQQAEPVEPVAWKQGNLVTFNEDPYPALGGLFVQFWDGEEVAARVYANDLETIRQRCAKVNTAPPQRKLVPLTEKEMYAVEEEARKNFRLSQKGPRGQQITYWDGLTPWLIRAVEKASWEKNHG